MPFGKAFVYQAPKRKKTEVFWSGITGLTLTADTDYNLVALLKALLAPAFGTLAPFFNTVSNKLNAYNDNASLMFKLNLAGLWSAATENRSMQLDFLGTNGNRLVASRDAAVLPDVVTLATFFQHRSRWRHRHQWHQPDHPQQQRQLYPISNLADRRTEHPTNPDFGGVNRLYRPFTGALTWHLAARRQTTKASRWQRQQWARVPSWCKRKPNRCKR